MDLEICRVRKSTLGNDKAGSDGSGKGSGNATQGGAGVLLPGENCLHSFMVIAHALRILGVSLLLGAPGYSLFYR